MANQSEFVEWFEPRRSPENRDFYMTYKQFIGLARAGFTKLLGISTGAVALILVVLLITGHRTPVKMALRAATFFLAMMLFNR